MQPFDALGLPSPDECLGILGLLLSVVGAAPGVVLLFGYGGAMASYVLIVASAFLGWVSFVYCQVWEQSFPLP